MEDRFQNPTKGYCDLVMKGGITSGVVYPRAVLELANEYRFRSLGGGSVGAIAAALAAAAELGREKRGFGRLEDEQQAMLKNKDFLLEIFRPTEAARPLMDTLLDLASARTSTHGQGKGIRSVILRSLISTLIRRNRRTFLKGALVGAVLGVAVVFVLAVALESALSDTNLYLSMLVVGAVSAFLVGLVWTIVTLLTVLIKEVPSRKNFYGMCVGHGNDPDQPLLTDWLSQVLDDISGIGDGRPLTFKDLKDKKLAGEDDPGILLKVMTTNLSHGEPYLFPRDFDTFIFKEEEMRRFFPGYVVDHMVNEAALPGVKLPKGFYFLPRGDALPVVVPVRMAVSFPILLCAVPVYTINPLHLRGNQGRSREIDSPDDLQVNWFSDGGICSNFPIHSFDAWLPRHPTFGINLTSLPEDRRRSDFSAKDVTEVMTGPAAGDRKSSEKVRLPLPDEPDYPEWTRFEGLKGFTGAVFHSAQNYRDNMQSRLPSYQERIVQIRLGQSEGGLNLAMDDKTIGDMVERGKEAGELLKRQFEFDHHRWVRLRVFMNQLETQLENAKEALDSIVDDRLLDKQRTGDFPYPIPDENHIAAAKEALQTLQEFAGQIGENLGGVSPSGPPQDMRLFPPVADEELKPTLRVTPDV